MSMKKETPSDVKLHLACVNGDLKTIKKLLDSGRVHVDCSDREGTTLLFWPLPMVIWNALKNCSSRVQTLLQGDTLEPLLFFAAQSGFVDIAQLLIKHGSLIDNPSVDGGTPLFVACQCDHLDVIELLIAHGARVNTQMKDGATPLFIAAQNGHARVVNLLLEHGAEVSLCRLDAASPLWIASQMNHNQVCRILLRAGHPVDTVRRNGATPLFKACHKGHVDVVQELLKHNPSLGILPNGESALHAACLFGHLPIVKMLVHAGADVRLPNQEGATPVQLAMQSGHKHIIDYLCQCTPVKPLNRG